MKNVHTFPTGNIQSSQFPYTKPTMNECLRWISEQTFACLSGYIQVNP